MPKTGDVAASREGLVPLTIYGRPATRQALKIAAAHHNTTIAKMMEVAIAAVLKRYGTKPA